MYTIRYGFLSELEADDILEPPEVQDPKLRELLTQSNDFMAFRRGKTVSVLRRDKIKSICTHDK